MCLEVHFQMIWLLKSFSAVQALEGFLSRVNPQVSLKAARTEETLVTLRTQIRPYACVVPHVDLQVAGLRETLFAVRALERFISCVVALVLEQLSEGEKGLSAVCTKEWSFSGVCEFMPGQAGLEREWLIAQSAFKSFLCAMAVRVWTNRVLYVRVLPTMCRKAWFLFGVGLLVFRQSPWVQKPLPAVRTTIWSLLQMDALVSQKSTTVCEALPTGTKEWSLWLMGQQVSFVRGWADEGGLTFGTLIGSFLCMDPLVSD